MPLVSFRDQLKQASQEGYGIPLFDIFEKLGSDGIYAAAEAKRAPTIVGVYGGLFDRPGGNEICAYYVERCKNATVPMSVFLDHGDSFERCIRAMHLGFTDVMYDGSQLPMEENIKTTQMVVRAARELGIGVEAELGHVGRGSDYEAFGSRREGFTRPDDVERFVEATDVDYLAIAIGSAHGQYIGEPRLDYELLAEIRRRVDIPLVMHGGSGLSDEQFREAIKHGIAKVNIFTDLALTASARLLEVANGETPNLMAMAGAIRSGFQDRCEHYLDVFGTTGRA